MTYDVAVIGAGVVGALTARELSKYELRICILEKGADVASGSSKANSAIVHAGYDPLPGTLKARFNVKGNEMFERLSQELEVPFKRIGSLVLAFNEADMEVLQKLYERGAENGVPGLEILRGYEDTARIEPNVSTDVAGALYAPSAAITCPYELTYAAVENAAANRAEIMLETEVAGISYEDDLFKITTSQGDISSRFIVNAAGVFSDNAAAMIGDNSFEIKPRKGEYLLLDKSQGDMARTIVFQTPSTTSKGILVTPTVDGNLLMGPTSTDTSDREDLSTAISELQKVINGALRSVPGINLKQVITSFTGLRATPDTSDFIVSPSPVNKKFIHAAGIESPGLTAAPAIAEYVAGLLKDAGLELVQRKDFNPVRKSIVRFNDASDGKKAELIGGNRQYGRVICRCELVTEAEIVEAIRRPAGARTVDAVKRRTRAGMGRCQGGFCAPRIVEILSRELGVPAESIRKTDGSSMLLTGRTKEAL
ncbi:MAG: NAD(P)/FAD-dependent oxidoreductase [Clostridiaceae bacterium]|nr:NAD(P)/FAD-dependent oxidoreductase [Clostridiaceae bacterium]